MSNITRIGISALALIAAGSAHSNHASAKEVAILNVSYDPTRELWRAINAAFIPKYEAQSGDKLVIKMSHAGSSSQARSVIDGLDGDVVTLAMGIDTDAIRKAGLIQPGWEAEFPSRSLPYVSTIVFVVRKGNPKGIRDWSDIVKPGIGIITPSPKTSGNGKLSFLAAWGSVIHAGGSEEDARAFVTTLYKQVPVLDAAARGSTTTFARKGIGDVHLTWENEAYLEVAEIGDDLEIVYPKASILAEPQVAVVDANVDRKGTRTVAEEYLKFLYTPEGQALIAQHHYRPTTDAGKKLLEGVLPPIELFPVTAIAKDWDDAFEKFFGTGREFDSIYEGGN